MDDNSNSAVPGLAEIVLETPPDVVTPVSSVGSSIFSEESLATMAAKLRVVESLLRICTRNINFQDFSREVLMTIMNAVHAEAGSLFEINYERNAIFFRAATGRSSDKVSNFELPLGQGIVGHVAESCQPLLVQDVASNTMHARAISNAVGFEVRNLIAVPLLIRGKAYGVLELLNRVGEPTFSAADQDLLVYIAEMTSKAIEMRLMLNWARQNESKKDQVTEGVAA